VAAQLSHRLLHHGAEPVVLGVAADGRSRRHPCFGVTGAAISRFAVLLVTARKAGLYGTASRVVSFGPPDEALQKEFDAATKVSAAWIATTWPDSRPREIIQTGQRYCQAAGFDPETQLGPPGHLIGRSAIELPLTAETDDLLQPGWAITWQASIGAALSCDTFLATADGPKLLTPTDSWPLKRIRIQGMKLVRPDILHR
jgi:Xaa-Pro dipeptidase